MKVITDTRVAHSISYRWSTFLFHCLFFYFFSYIVENSLLTSLDVDQSTSNIYYTTQGSVKVFSPKDSTTRSLITGLSQPDDIKLYPQAGYVRWSCINYIPVICLFISQIRSIIAILFISLWCFKPICFISRKCCVDSNYR